MRRKTNLDPLRRGKIQASNAGEWRVWWGGAPAPLGLSRARKCCGAGLGKVQFEPR